MEAKGGLKNESGYCRRTTHSERRTEYTPSSVFQHNFGERDTLFTSLACTTVMWSYHPPANNLHAFLLPLIPPPASRSPTRLPRLSLARPWVVKNQQVSRCVLPQEIFESMLNSTLMFSSTVFFRLGAQF